MGLGSLKSAWYRQTEDFGHKRSEDYSVLVLDASNPESLTPDLSLQDLILN